MTLQSSQESASTVAQRNMVLGILAGLAAGFFWGVPFLAPQVLADFQPMDIAFGRFFFFGLVSLIFVRPAWAVWTALSSSDSWKVIGLSASGYWLYSSFLFLGVRLTDGVISSLIVGLLPVTVALLGSQGRKLRPAVWVGLLLITAGLVTLFGYPMLIGGGMPDAADLSGSGQGTNLPGILILVIALLLWTAYAIMNTRFLQKHRNVPAKDLASLMGILSLIFMLPIWLIGSNPAGVISHPRLGLFLIFAAILGVGGSWIANWLWNLCSQRCPPHVSGPLIVSETFFGLLYSFVFVGRWPLAYETAAIGLLMLGVFVSVRSALKG